MVGRQSIAHMPMIKANKKHRLKTKKQLDSALFDAVDQGDVEKCAQCLFNGANANASRRKSYPFVSKQKVDFLLCVLPSTPLGTASFLGDEKIVALLIEHGADCNLLVCIRYAHHLLLRKINLERCECQNTWHLQQLKGWKVTCLELAVWRSHEGVVALLAVHLHSSQAQTFPNLLELAVICGNASVVKHILMFDENQGWKMLKKQEFASFALVFWGAELVSYLSGFKFFFPSNSYQLVCIAALFDAAECAKWVLLGGGFDLKKLKYGRPDVYAGTLAAHKSILVTPWLSHENVWKAGSAEFVNVLLSAFLEPTVSQKSWKRVKGFLLLFCRLKKMGWFVPRDIVCKILSCDSDLSKDVLSAILHTTVTTRVFRKFVVCNAWEVAKIGGRLRHQRLLTRECVVKLLAADFESRVIVLCKNRHIEPQIVEREEVISRQIGFVPSDKATSVNLTNRQEPLFLGARVDNFLPETHNVILGVGRSSFVHYETVSSKG